MWLESPLIIFHAEVEVKNISVQIIKLIQRNWLKESDLIKQIQKTKTN